VVDRGAGGGGQSVLSGLTNEDFSTNTTIPILKLAASVGLNTGEKCDRPIELVVKK